MGVENAIGTNRGEADPAEVAVTPGAVHMVAPVILLNGGAAAGAGFAVLPDPKLGGCIDAVPLAKVCTGCWAVGRFPAPKAEGRLTTAAGCCRLRPSSWVYCHHVATWPWAKPVAAIQVDEVFEPLVPPCTYSVWCNFSNVCVGDQLVTPIVGAVGVKDATLLKSNTEEGSPTYPTEHVTAGQGVERLRPQPILEAYATRSVRLGRASPVFHAVP
mmetsp:Transcript_5056/g.10630  ORF Transcript_5056/g.10630 Transcript_5056/m.10630 type:complete len:215 (-) Transcript_5056:2-646(-)